jgi:ABC-type transport system involved in cytochrome bd biosynthesis fused ATPase/permease subunit
MRCARTSSCERPILEADVKARLGEPARGRRHRPQQRPSRPVRQRTLALLDLRKVCDCGPARVLHGLDLSVNRGETLVVIGRSGVGKRR